MRRKRRTLDVSLPPPQVSQKEGFLGHAELWWTQGIDREKSSPLPFKHLVDEFQVIATRFEVTFSNPSPPPFSNLKAIVLAELTLDIHWNSWIWATPILSFCLPSSSLDLLLFRGESLVWALMAILKTRGEDITDRWAGLLPIFEPI